MIKVGLFAYGEMGFSALKALLDDRFQVMWIITPLSDSDSQDSSKVENLAKEQNIKIVRSNSNAEIYELITSEVPDVVVIGSYNKILSEKILTTTKFINIHHGDLPRFRGRANINWAIIIGREEIGLTFHEAVPNLDSGNIYAQYMLQIEKEDTIASMYNKVNQAIEKDLANIVSKVLDGYKGEEQKGDATYCCTRLPEDGLINWQQTSEQIYNFIRALTKPYPGAFTYFEGKKLIMWESELPQNPKVYEGRIPGRIASIDKDKGVEVLTGDSSIIIKAVEYEGKELNASEVISSVKKTLGIDFVQLYEKMQTLLENK